MKCFYLAGPAAMAAIPAGTTFHALSLTPTVSFVVVELWSSHADQDVWEALPGTLELPLWAWTQPAPPALVSVLASVGVVTGDTIGQAIRKLRATWSAARA